MARFLHLVPDDKFIPCAKRVLEAAFPGENQYRIFTNNEVLRFAQEDRNARRVTHRYFFSSALRRDLARADFLLVHFMNPWFARAVEQAPHDTLVMWVGWGGDYYHLIPSYRHSLHLPQTERLAARLGPMRPKTPPRNFLKRVERSLIHRVLFREWERRILGRIDVMSGFPSEHALLQDAFPAFRAAFHVLHLYYNVESTFTGGPAIMQGDDVLVGNSAYPTNNHAEAFAMLERQGVGDRRVVVPLSYGREDYADEVCRLGRAAFGSRFVPLRTFMPLRAYNEVIGSCSTVVMNSVRQQAFGNICTTLYKGARVYIRRENLILPYLRDRGVTIGAIQDAETSGTDFFAKPTAEEVASTQDALRSLLSFDSAVDAVRRLESFRPGVC